MSTLPRSVSLAVGRTGLGALVLGFALVGLWTASDLWGQDPDKAGNAANTKKQRVEEEEDTPPKKAPNRKVMRRVEKEEDAKKPAPSRPNAPAAGDLRQLAEQAKHPAVRELFRSLAVPHDLMQHKKLEHVTTDQKQIAGKDLVEPIPYYLGSEPGRSSAKLSVNRLDPITWKVLKPPFHPNLPQYEFVRPYEEIAEEKVNEFLKDESIRGLSRFEKLVAAEQVLSAVLRWHESAIQTGTREGKEWERIEAELRRQLFENVLLKQLEILADEKDWDGSLALVRRLAAMCTNDADRRAVAKPVAELINKALNDPTASEEKKQQARKRLQQLDEEFPDSPVFAPLTEGLRNEAERTLKDARELKTKGDIQNARRLWAEARDIWPNLPGLSAFGRELNNEHPVLRVGVRGQLPQYLSPAWACTDNERRVVEMLFESLVKLTPDDAGLFHYRLGLTEYRPKVVPLGREFQLPPKATWYDPKASPDKPAKRLDASDIRATVSLLQEGVGTGRSFAWGQLLDTVEVKGDPFRVTLRLKQGYLDPLALMTFKILPRDQRVDTEDFARDPVCSGPFHRMRGPLVVTDENQRQYMGFVANPSYSLRPSKRDLPHIQEVRLYVCQNPIDDFRHGKLDLVLDLTGEEAGKLKNAGDVQVTVALPSPATPNRRIYFLAINQSRLPDPKLRQALAFAINREAILTKYFRGPLPVHKALNGPFPVGSWACNPSLAGRAGKDNLDLFNFDRAKDLSSDPSVKKAIGGAPLKLKYPLGDQAVEDAMRELADQVNKATGIELQLEKCTPYQLREDVEQTQRYDLAYYHYDFPDETYWLGPLLSPLRAEAPDNNSPNMFNFTDDSVQRSLREAISYRDFTKVRQYAQVVHKYLNDVMPFIPLWQLDPLLAYTRDVQPVGLDPLLVFTNIEEWHLHHR